MKKLVSMLLVLAALLTLAVPALAFSDVTDPTSQKEIAVLQMMDVINGMTATTFAPGGTLTRAQFCKMAVILKGDQEKEPLYRNRTIFPDVRSTHWARGYINLAVSTDIGADEEGKNGTKLIRGMGNGTFQPDRAITYAEAVTILIRLLGYSDADAGMNWPNGYLDLAGRLGLTSGMSLGANQPLTRAQAAHLFFTMLNTEQKSGSPYYNAIGSSANTDVVLMDGSVKADDGTPGAMRTSAGTYKTVSGTVPQELVGCRGTLVTNAAGKAVAFIPRGEQESFTVRKASGETDNVQANWIVDQSGQKHMIAPSVPAYTREETSTYEKVWMDLRGGAQVTVFYSDAGKVDGIYVGGGASASDTAAVAYSGASTDFQSILGGAVGYSVFRDGSPATLSDVCQYDVATYDPAARVLSISSGRLTGRYDDAKPNPQSPSTISVMGSEPLQVLDMAAADLANHKLGDTITVLLTADGQVAGVVSTAAARSENLGVVDEADGVNVKVTLLCGVEVSGQCSSTQAKKGELVRVSSNGAGKLSVNRVSGASSGELNVEKATLGSAPLSAGCRIFERVSSSATVELHLEDLPATVIPASKISYSHRNSGGQVDVIVLNDATGDAYTYGMVKVTTRTEESMGNTHTVQELALFNSDHPNGTGKIDSAQSVKRNSMVGLAFSADGTKITASRELQSEKNIRRSDFQTSGGVTWVNVGSRRFQVSDQVQCYNKATGKWLSSLEEARGFSDNLTIYYDRPADQGGKIRIVVAE